MIQSSFDATRPRRTEGPKSAVKTRVVCVIVLLAGAASPGARAEGPAVDYLRDVKPILTRRCVACHGVLKQKSGLRLDTAARALRGGDGGPAVVPGKSDESPLIDLASGDGALRMPPEGEGEPVPPEDLKTLRSWIDAGASAPSHEPDPPDPRDHWAFHAPMRPIVPVPRDTAWVRNPIDAFLASRHDALAILPAPMADRAVLLRRVSLDLTGLALIERRVAHISE